MNSGSGARRVLVGANLTLRLLLELAALGALAVGGYGLGGPLAVRVAAAVLLPTVGVVLWGRYAAPRRKVPDAVVGWYLSQLAVWGGAVAVLALAGHGAAAWVLGGLMVVNTVVLWVLGEWSPAITR